jgi:hypothetical protein
MKGTLLTLALLVFAGSTSLAAQNNNRWSNRDSGWHRANLGHHTDRYRDSDYDRDRDIRQDAREIDHDRWEIRDDLRRGDYRAADREREELRQRERDLYRDRHGRCDRGRNYGSSYNSRWDRSQRWDWMRFASMGWR